MLTGATDGQTALGAAMGMLYLFVLGVALLAPWINQAAARLLGPVLRTVWGDSGYLAAANLRANARGTVAVLTALVLSVGLGGTVWFLQDNLERQTVVQSREGVLAQYVLTSGAGLRPPPWPRPAASPGWSPRPACAAPPSSYPTGSNRRPSPRRASTPWARTAPWTCGFAPAASTRCARAPSLSPRPARTRRLAAG